MIHYFKPNYHIAFNQIVLPIFGYFAQFKAYLFFMFFRLFTRFCSNFHYFYTHFCTFFLLLQFLFFVQHYCMVYSPDNNSVQAERAVQPPFPSGTM